MRKIKSYTNLPFRTTLYTCEIEVASYGELPNCALALFNYKDLPEGKREKFFNLLRLLFPYLPRRLLLALLNSESTCVNINYVRRSSRKYTLQIALERVAKPVKALWDYQVLELVEKAEN
ncbi:hypothetical protein NO2_0608 [Candidatus Termititenax persephonae]|uniref:Uncharacterized protein n=1 Tax=Candidatus Termititenax persephonae TaxID=2218525 RepID=A0A388TFZ2_9BACT|nr:hypothetical protein NO2_0608 [Candidatus Termititenax persephonae]